jgi:hypothetical protein
LITESLKNLALACHSHGEAPLSILNKLIQHNCSPLSKDILLSSIGFARRSDALAALEHMTSLGIFNEDSNVYYCLVSSTEVQLLYTLLMGMKLAPKIHLDDNLTIALTPPKSPNKLEGAIKKLGPQTGLIQKTDEIFEHLASETKKSLIVMTPFLDSAGAEFLKKLYSKVTRGLEKKLILRFLSFDPSDPKYPSGYLEIKEALEDLEVEVFDYSIQRQGSKMLETFHAKAILSDNNKAYIGSSNFDKFSLENSMELGAYISGDPVRLVANIINSILSISVKIH